MGKFLPKPFARSLQTVLGLSVAGLLGSTLPASAQFCTVNCSSRQIQFTPGQLIRIFVVNRTDSLVQIEQVYGTDPIALLPNQEVEVDPNFGTRPNASLVFWDETTLPLRTILSRPDKNVLRVEILPGERPPGDRSVYVEDDGKVRIF